MPQIVETDGRKGGPFNADRHPVGRRKRLRRRSDTVAARTFRRSSDLLVPRNEAVELLGDRFEDELPAELTGEDQAAVFVEVTELSLLAKLVLAVVGHHLDCEAVEAECAASTVLRGRLPSGSEVHVVFLVVPMTGADADSGLDQAQFASVQADRLPSA